MVGANEKEKRIEIEKEEIYEKEEVEAKERQTDYQEEGTNHLNKIKKVYRKQFKCNF